MVIAPCRKTEMKRSSIDSQAPTMDIEIKRLQWISRSSACNGYRDQAILGIQHKISQLYSMIRYYKSIRLKKYLKVNRFFMHLKNIIDLTISL